MQHVVCLSASDRPKQPTNLLNIQLLLQLQPQIMSFTLQHATSSCQCQATPHPSIGPQQSDVYPYCSMTSAQKVTPVCPSSCMCWGVLPGESGVHSNSHPAACLLQAVCLHAVADQEPWQAISLSCIEPGTLPLLLLSVCPETHSQAVVACWQSGNHLVEIVTQCSLLISAVTAVNSEWEAYVVDTHRLCCATALPACACTFTLVQYLSLWVCRGAAA